MSEIRNNEVNICGEIALGFAYSHTVHGTDFYKADLLTSRFSGRSDSIPLMLSESLVNVNKGCGCKVKITGRLQSYNQRIGNKAHLKLSVNVDEIYFIDRLSGCEDNNEIFLDGYICRPPVFRITPFKREIVDILLAVNRPYRKSDYIPCIAWGRDAKYLSRLGVGTEIGIKGRIQSREYIKKLSETECEKRVAYEVSVSKLESIKESVWEKSSM